MKRPRMLGAALALAGVALLAAACGGVQNPEGWASPTVDGQTIYFFPKKDRLVAVTTAESGQATQKWQFPNGQKDISFNSVYDSPLQIGNALYFASWDKKIYSLDVTNGSILWSGKNLDGGVVAGPVAVNGVLFFGTTDNKVYALAADTGSPAPGWPANGVQVPDAVWASPVVHGQDVYVATMGGDIFRLNAADGSQAPQKVFSTRGAIADMNLLDDNHLFVPTLNKDIYILDLSGDPAKGAIRVGTEDWVWSRAAFKDGVAYFADLAGKVYAIDITSGQMRWQSAYDAETKVKSSPVIIGDTLVVASREPAIHFIDIATGTRKNSVPLKDVGTVRAGLAVDGDRVLIATTNGSLLEADVTKLQVTPLPITGVS